MAKNTWGLKNTWSALPPSSVRGDELPTTGKDGACALIEGGFVDPVLEAADLFRAVVTSPPAVGELGFNIDSSFSWTALDGQSSSFTFEWYKNEINQGPVVVNVRISSSGIPTIPAEFRGTFNDAAEYLRTQGYTGTVNDILAQWLFDNLANREDVNDMWIKYWEGLGLIGAFSERYEKWKDS